MEFPQQVFLFLIALIANAFSALAGGGAGLIQFPMLIFLGLPFAVALATHKIASVALGLGATLRHAREKNLDWQFSVFILLTGLPGVVLGAVLILEVPERLAEIALGILTIGLGLYSYFNPSLGQEHRPQHRDLNGYLIGGSLMCVVGVLNGSLTSGTGLFATMLQVRWFGVDYQRAVAHTLVLVGLFWNGTGAVILGIIGQAQWDWLPALLLGSILGGYIGAHWAIVQGNQVIKRAFEVLTVLVGIKLLLG